MIPAALIWGLLAATSPPASPASPDVDRPRPEAPLSAADDVTALQQAVLELGAERDALRARAAALEAQLATERHASDLRESLRAACESSLATQAGLTAQALGLVDTLTVLHKAEKRAGRWRAFLDSLRAGALGFGAGYVTSEAVNSRP